MFTHVQGCVPAHVPCLGMVHQHPVDELKVFWQLTLGIGPAFGCHPAGTPCVLAPATPTLFPVALPMGQSCLHSRSLNFVWSTMAGTTARWDSYVQARLAANPRQTVQDIEAELLDGNAFDPDEPYVLELARLALDAMEPIQAQ